MSGLVKLRCSVGDGDGRQVWADLVAQPNRQPEESTAIHTSRIDRLALFH